MGRRRNSLLDVMAAWPWYINAAVGGLGFATLRWLLPAWRQPVTAATGDILLQILAQLVGMLDEFDPRFEILPGTKKEKYQSQSADGQLGNKFLSEY